MNDKEIRKQARRMLKRTKKIILSSLKNKAFLYVKGDNTYRMFGTVFDKKKEKFYRFVDVKISEVKLKPDEFKFKPILW